MKLGEEAISKIYPYWTLKDIIDVQVNKEVMNEMWNTRISIFVESYNIPTLKNTLLLHIKRILKREQYDIKI